MSIEDTIEPFLGLKSDLLPPGLKDWRKFGAPKGAPGQTVHHPGVNEHELYGWLLTMHFLAVLELAAVMLFANDRPANDVALPPPITGKNIAPSALSSLFYGARAGSEWAMNRVLCHTTFEPIMNNKGIVVSGIVGADLDLTLPRGAQLYNTGWVLDLGSEEKKAKMKLERYGGLGYIDSKKAYYGVRASGPLELFLPCTEREDLHIAMQDSVQEVLARDCFQNVVVCEVNDKHVTGKECNLNTDLSFVVGGSVSHDIKPVNATGAFYWGRNVCIRVGIPPQSTLSRSEGGSIGLALQLSVASTSVTIRSGPCSVSHIVWEQTNKVGIST